MRSTISKTSAPVLLADRVAEHAAEQADVGAQRLVLFRLGGLALFAALLEGERHRRSPERAAGGPARQAPLRRGAATFVQRIKARRKQFAQCGARGPARPGAGPRGGSRVGVRTADSWPRPPIRSVAKVSSKFGAETRAQGGRVLQLAFVDRQRPPAHRRQRRASPPRRGRGCARSWRASIRRWPSACARRAGSRAHARSSRGRKSPACGGRRRCPACPAGRRDRAGSRARTP